MLNVFYNTIQTPNYVYGDKLSCVLPANVVADKSGNNKQYSSNSDIWHLARNCSTKKHLKYVIATDN